MSKAETSASRRAAPLPRVVLCAALTVDGKLDTREGSLRSLVQPGKNRARAGHPWAEWYDDPATVVWAEAAVAASQLPEDFARERVASVDPSGSVDDPRARLRALAREQPGARRVVCLGGAELFRKLLEAGLAREILLSIRPRIDGRRNAATLSGPPGAEFFPASVAGRLLKLKMWEGECWLHYRVRRATRHSDASARD